jgi:DHA1 family multidrug resistance protein-like MFS transporter
MLASSDVSQRAKRRGLITILATTFLMWAGFFMVIPLISVYYVDKLGWAAASIGLVLAVRQFTQQGLTPISGVLADRIGAKGLICAGLLVRSVGFGLMAWADTFPILLLSAVLAALGGSMFESPKQAAVAALTDETNRNRYYSLSGVVSGLGLTLGAQIGVLLLGFDFSLVALGAGICFFCTFLVTLIFLPPVRVSTEAIAGSALTYGVRLALRDRPFMLFNLLIMGYWFMWVQLTISLPLAAKAIGGNAETVGLVYAINSVMSIVLQYPLLRLASCWLRPLPILVIGVLTMALGLGGIALASNVLALALCVVVFAAGALLAMPSQQTVAANLANPVALGSYFGVSSLALAIGGGVGNLSGGLLYDLGRQLAFPELPWLVFCLVGLAAGTGLGVMASHQRRQEVTEAQRPDLATAA